MVVECKVEPVNIHVIEARLERAREKAPQVMSKAINFTLNDLRDMMAKKIQETYTVKSSGFRKAWKKNKVDKANPSKLEATIYIKGKRLSFADFILDPNKRPNKQPDYYKGKFMVKSALKELVANNGNKGFFAKMPNNGHKGIFYRISNDSSNRKIAEITAPSLPIMAGDENNVYDVVAPKVQVALNNNVQKLIEKELLKK